jgi:hypothetical protein
MKLSDAMKTTTSVILCFILKLNRTFLFQLTSILIRQWPK